MKIDDILANDATWKDKFIEAEKLFDTVGDWLDKQEPEIQSKYIADFHDLLGKVSLIHGRMLIEDRGGKHESNLYK